MVEEMDQYVCGRRKLNSRVKTSKLDSLLAYCVSVGCLMNFSVL